MMATIKDIAKLSGYSIGTVSRVINHRPDVSPEARKRIEEIIQRENFQPNSNAKLLKQRGTSSITVLVKGIANSFLESILEEMQISLHSHGEEINVVFLDEEANEIKTALQICREQKPKGLIFLGGNRRYFSERFSEIKVPAVLVSDTAEDLGFANLSSFTTDDFKAARMAIDFLTRRGHQRIAIIGGSLNDENGLVGARRVQGALDMLKEKGLTFDLEKDYVSCRFSMQDGYNAMQELLKKADGITGIFAVSDMIAIGAVRAAADAGLKVPDDLSIIGFDGIDYVRYSVPRLATIMQDTKQLAERSVEDLLMRISYTRNAVHEMIPFRVITGESIRQL